MIGQLKKHHIGIIIEKEKINFYEKKYSKKFHIDKQQGTRVLFVPDQELGFYKEYIVKEGRAKNLPTGFYHICYTVNNKNELAELETYIRTNKLGYPITKLEKSGSKECGWVKFFLLKNLGFIEINLTIN